MPSSSRNSAGVLSAVALAVCALSGCSAAAKTVASAGATDVAVVPPLFSQHQALDGARERDLLFPFIHQRETAKDTGWGIRPLFFTTKGKSGFTRETTFLWPLGRYSAKPGELEFRLIPLFSYKARYNEDGVVDSDWIVLPGIFAGTDKKEGDYFAFLPFYGTVRGLLARDSMDFVLFPLYVKTHDGGYEGLNILFPLYASGEGDGRTVSTVFPFYLRQSKEGRYDKRTYLWPFFHDHKLNLNTADPVRILSFFPFYSREDSTSGQIEARGYLWPFFGYRLDRGRGYVEYDMPWPFFRYLRSEKIDHTRVWPFWSRWENKAKHITDYQVLWPIGWASHLDDEKMTKDSLWILPLYWDHHARFKRKDGAYDESSERSTHLWPLFHRNRSRTGDLEFAVLSPWWFEDTHPYGFRDNYDPFFTLFYYGHRAADDESLTSVLGPLVRVYRKADRDWRLQVLPFRYERSGTGDGARRGWALLEGLVGYENDGGAKTLRLLWIPITWGAKAAPEGAK